MEYVSGDGSRSQQPGPASHAHERELVHSALLKLKGLALIQFAEEHIAITDEGRRCLEGLPIVTLRLRGRWAEARDTKADRQVATTLSQAKWYQEHLRCRSRSTARGSRLSQLPARLRTRYSALSRILATTLRPEYATWVKRLCQHYLAKVGVAMPQVCNTIGQRWDTPPYTWKHKVAAMIRSGATTVVHVLVQLGKPLSRKLERLYEKAREGNLGPWLSKLAGGRGLSLSDIKFAGFDLSRSINYAGALLLVCSPLAIVVGVLFLAGERANSSPDEAAFLSGNRPGISRASPIVWLHDGADRPGRSIFVARKLAGAAWIEGFAITGENASNQTLIDLEGTLKTDSGEEIKLDVSTEGRQGKWVDAQDVPSGSKLILKSALDPDGTQTGMRADEFLSKYGGMILRVSYVVGGVQTTLMEYFSNSKLRAQLADLN
jgi:hypothetical protein